MLTEIKKPVGTPASNTALLNTEVKNNSTIFSDQPKSLCEITPSHCPKYLNCSATICPLDPDWRRRAYIKGERVCLYLREVGKSSVLDKLKGTLPSKVLEVMLDQRPLICVAHAPINSILKNSAKTKSKLVQPQFKPAKEQSRDQVVLRDKK